MRHRSETWHMVKILYTLEDVCSQDDICNKAVIHNQKLNKYLKKFLKLGMVVRVENKKDGIDRNGRAILWKVTELGRDYRVVIEKYVKA